MSSRSYDSFASTASILAAISIFAYAVAFLQLQNPLIYSICLMLMSLLSAFALLAVYDRAKEVESRFARLALVLALVGAFGAFVHGGYDLSNAVQPPDANAAALANLPSQVDPRGLLTFGVAGLGLLINAMLIAGGKSRLPQGLGYLGIVLGLLLVEIYLARMIVLDPKNPLLGLPVLVTGYALNPLFYLWLGVSLWSEGRAGGE